MRNYGMENLGKHGVIEPIPVAELSKARGYGRSLAGIVGSNSAWVMDVCPFKVLCVVR
jgi:hypothetical protein